MAFEIYKYGKGTESQLAHSLAVNFLYKLDKKIEANPEKYGWLDGHEWEIRGVFNSSKNALCDEHNRVDVICRHLISSCGNYKVDLRFRVEEVVTLNDKGRCESSKVVVTKHVSHSPLEYDPNDFSDDIIW